MFERKIIIFPGDFINHLIMFIFNKHSLLNNTKMHTIKLSYLCNLLFIVSPVSILLHRVQNNWENS